jgi:hypothetical protein
MWVQAFAPIDMVMTMLKKTLILEEQNIMALFIMLEDQFVFLEV